MSPSEVGLRAAPFCTWGSGWSGPCSAQSRHGRRCGRTASSPAHTAASCIGCSPCPRTAPPSCTHPAIWALADALTHPWKQGLAWCLTGQTPSKLCGRFMRKERLTLCVRHWHTSCTVPQKRRGHLVHAGCYSGGRCSLAEHRQQPSPQVYTLTCQRLQVSRALPPKASLHP